MTRVRRRVLRNNQPITATEARRLDRIQKKREQLDKDRAALRRWSTKLLCGVPNYAEFRAATSAKFCVESAV